MRRRFWKKPPSCPVLGEGTRTGRAIRQMTRSPGPHRSPAGRADMRQGLMGSSTRAQAWPQDLLPARATKQQGGYSRAVLQGAPWAWGGRVTEKSCPRWPRAPGPSVSQAQGFPDQPPPSRLRTREGAPGNPTTSAEYE